MSKSFFERLTGSIRMDNNTRAAPDEPAVKTQKEKRTRPKDRGAAASALPPDALVSIKDAGADEEKDGGHKTHIPQQSFNAGKEEAAATPQAAEEDDNEGELMLDVYDGGNYFTIQSVVAGARPEELDISVTDNILTIRGQRKQQYEASDDRYYTKELYWGKFSRSVVLPEEVESEKIEATLKNGLLTIRLPKKDRGQKKVRIKLE